jgi:hypothetical protein
VSSRTFFITLAVVLAIGLILGLLSMTLTPGDFSSG